MSDEELIARLRDEHVAASRTEAADRIEALIAERDAAREYAGEVRKREMAAEDARISATDNLAKAVEALDEAVYLLDPDEKDMMRQAGVYRIVTTLAEIKGESHE